MAIVVKTAPKGIDYYIDKLQRHLFNNLVWTNYQSYHRGYRNPKGDSFIPEVYVGENEYKEVFFDDRFAATSYFLVDEENPIEKNGVQPIVSLYYQVRLDKLEPGIPHRADEEIINEVLFWINKNPYGIKATSRLTGIPNVYSGLDQEQNKFDNMSEFLVFRIIMDFPIVAPDFCPAVTNPVCADATILDSDGVTFFNVVSGGSGACTRGIVPSGILYFPPIYNGQDVSYASFDAKALFDIGEFTYTPPVNPIHAATLASFFVLDNNNTFGNTDRFTDTVGGQVYGAGNGSVVNYVIDHHTRLGWRNTDAGIVNWATALSNADASTFGGFGGWRVPLEPEYNSIALRDLSLLPVNKTLAFDYAPFNYPFSSPQTCEISPAITTSRLAIRDGHLAANVAVTGVAATMNCRNHF